MARSIRLRHTQSNLTKMGYYGFSWTYLFFGWFVPLLRGEIGVAALHFFLTCISFGLFWIIFAFIYNKQYMHRMLTSGWEFYDTPDHIKNAEFAMHIVKNI